MKKFKAQEQETEEISIVLYVKVILSKFYWIILFALVAGLLANIYLRYKDRKYRSSASIKIESDNNSILEDAAIFKQFGSVKDKVLTESYIIKSRSIISQALDNLPMGIGYFAKGRVVNNEIYKSPPFFVEVLEAPEDMPYGMQFDISIEKENDYTISYTVGEKKISKKLAFGDTYEALNVRFKITKNEHDYDHSVTDNYYFVFNDPDKLIERVSQGLDVRPAERGVTLINISYEDKTPRFAADIVNELCKVYIDRDIRVKSQAANQTIYFLDTLLKDMTNRVRSSDQVMEQFKKNNSLVDVLKNAEISIEQLSDLETQQNLLEIQKLAITSLEEQLDKEDGIASLNFSLDELVDPILPELIVSLNTLNIDRISLKNRYAENSQPIQEIDEKIEEVKRSIRSNIKQAKLKTKNKLAYVSNEIAKARNVLNSIPTQERDYLNIKRDLEVNQKVYAYLLEKSLEASISRAAIVSTARVIDKAFIPKVPFSPTPLVAYFIALFLGVMSGSGMVILIYIVNRKIYNQEDVENQSTIPVLGSILNYPGKLSPDESRMLVLEDQRSMFCESIRAVRTNMQFIDPDKKAKIISITSTISGEGKTFTSINLAGSLTLLNKRIILIGCDLRKPQLNNTFNVTSEKGLSTYLVGQYPIEEIILTSKYNNLDVIPSGPIPPNPTELLQSARMRDLLEKLEDTYDYIILDTPPVGLVSDALVLLKMSDISIYILKAGYSKRDFVSLPSRLIDEHNLKNVFLVLNSLNLRSGSGYRGYNGKYYGYGGYYSSYYTDGNPPMPWWRKLWRKKPS